MKIAGGPYADKAILRDIKSKKPFLLFSTNKDSLAFDQNYLLESSDYIGDFSGGKVYACYPDRLAANDKKYSDSVTRLLSYMSGADTFITGNENRYLNHFDDGTADAHLFGKGAASYIKHEESLIATIPVHEMRDSVPYEFSCWFLLRRADYKSPEIILQCCDSAGKIIRPIVVSTIESVDSHDLWFRDSRYFNMPAGCRYIRCMLHDSHNFSYVAMDEMLLRPADALVVSKAADGSIMVNNHLFKSVKH